MADPGQSSTLRFTCDECGTHLGFDESLAGMQAPCPKCGALIVAPEPKSRESRLPSSGVVRGVSGGGFQAAPRDREPVMSSRGSGRRRVSSSSSGGRRRKVAPGEGSPTNEFQVLIKIMIAVALAVFVVVLVTWYLKNQ